MKLFCRDRTAKRVYRSALVIVVAIVCVYIWSDDRARPAWVASSTDRQPANVPASALRASKPASPDTAVVIYTGRVIKVADGDSVRFATASGVRRIRLDSIDAPEQSGGRARPGQPHAEASRRHLEQWLAERRVSAHCYAPDQYGRDLCVLQDDTGATANRAQVTAGYAWAYTAAKGRYLRDVTFIEAQAQARAAGRGLWVDPQPIAPWTWRYDCWRRQRCRGGQ